MSGVRPTPLKVPAKIEADQDLRGFFKDITRSIYQLFYAASEFTASETQDITASVGVTYNNRVTRVRGAGGAVTVTATPSVKPIDDGKEIIIQGDSDTSTVTLQDESALPNSGLALAGGASMTLGKGDILYLVYDEGDSKYYEVSRSNN